MYIVKNFLSDMANSTGGGERASKIMGFPKKNFLVTLSDFPQMAILRANQTNQNVKSLTTSSYQMFPRFLPDVLEGHKKFLFFLFCR